MKRSSTGADRQVGIRRDGVVLLVLALAAALLAVLPAAPAQAAIDQAFTRQFRTDDYGDILIRGNSLMVCPPAASTCASARAGTATGGDLNNNGYAMVYADADADAGTTTGA